MKYIAIDNNDLLPVLRPCDYTEREVLFAMKRLGRVMSSECIAVFESEETLSAYKSLCEETGAAPKCILRKDIESESLTVPERIRQMVVLTARNDDIMASLPFIESYMGFIEELVVCCPERNILPFSEKYKGRLSLRFISDDELLKGRPLPKDHQTRNFFLRCCLMEREELDDAFIMTDDDYRPMKPITEKVFVSDGQYQGYYFYDAREWQGTYNDYTSFDCGVFATRAFLTEAGYPTLQYSSHQPQVIDKRIFREMLCVHPGIEFNPYCEWTTYFNFLHHHHPELLSPRPYVSMCWPGDLASWDLYVEPGEFLFENYYGEQYAAGGIFEGMSKELCDRTEDENREKSRLYRSLTQEQLFAQSVYKNYAAEYAREKGYEPCITVYRDDKGRLQLSLPERIRLCENAWTRVPVCIERDVYSGGELLSLSYHFLSRTGVPLLNSPEIPIKTGDSELMLPVRSPKAAAGCTVFTVKAMEASASCNLEIKERT